MFFGVEKVSGTLSCIGLKIGNHSSEKVPDTFSLFK
jgi:hypothetical protein